MRNAIIQVSIAVLLTLTLLGKMPAWNDPARNGNVSIDVWMEKRLVFKTTSADQ